MFITWTYPAFYVKVKLIIILRMRVSVYCFSQDVSKNITGTHLACPYIIYTPASLPHHRFNILSFRSN